MIPFSTSPVTLQTDKKISSINILQYIFFGSAILYFGKSLFIPLSFSLLVSFILYPVCKWMEKKGLSRSLSIFISLFVITILFSCILYLLFVQLVAFSHEWHSLQAKLSETYAQLTVFLSIQFGISAEQQLEYLKSVTGNSGSQFMDLLKSTAYSFSSIFFFLFLIPIFSALILYHRDRFVKVLYGFFSIEKRKTIHEILVETIHAYYNFIKGMIVVYFVVGLLNSIGLLILGVPHPFLFGYIASVLTFIPYIGIMIASLLPITVSWITFNSIWYPIGVIIIFTIVQILEANIIFPFAVSSRLNVNTLTVLVMILAGGIIWGAAGMILFIPMIGIVKLIADRTESLKPISDLIGG